MPFKSHIIAITDCESLREFKKTKKYCCDFNKKIIRKLVVYSLLLGITFCQKSGL